MKANIIIDKNKPPIKRTVYIAKIHNLPFYYCRINGRLYSLQSTNKPDTFRADRQLNYQEAKVVCPYLL